MRVVDEEPQETIHLYVFPEDQLPLKPEYPSIGVALFAALCIFAILGISVFSAPPAGQDVSFTLTIQGYRLAPGILTRHLQVPATGKGHTPATNATGIITMYNGLAYTQIVPVGTRLTGADSVSVLTDAQAVIPPAAQTSPPTYGHTNVQAHTIMPGISGNIQAGDINMACCATAIIAQNPYAFTGGRNARNFTYLTSQDVSRAVSSLVPALQAQALARLPTPLLTPQCSPTVTSSPRAGKETKSAQLTLVETCSADSYSEQAVGQAITTYSKRFGTGTLTHVQFFVVGVSGNRGVAIMLYVVGRWKPLEIRRTWTGK